MKLPRKPRTGECMTCVDLKECNMRSSGCKYCAAKKEPKNDTLREFAEWCLEPKDDIQMIHVKRRARLALEMSK